MFHSCRRRNAAVRNQPFQPRAERLMYLTRKSLLRDRLARASGDHFPGRPSFCSEFLIMTRLTEIAGAGSTSERWDLRSLDLASIAQTAETLRPPSIAGPLERTNDRSG